MHEEDRERGKTNIGHFVLAIGAGPPVRQVRTAVAQRPDELFKVIHMVIDSEICRFGNPKKIAQIDKIRIAGFISILTKNKLAVGVREALQGQFELATQLIVGEAATSLGNLGISTRGDTPDFLMTTIAEQGFTDCKWSGIRVFTDHLPASHPYDSDYPKILRLEEVASNHPVFRQLGRLVHVIARKWATDYQL